MTHSRVRKSLLAVLLSSVLLPPVVLADPPADKGKSKGAAAQAEDRGKNEVRWEDAAQERHGQDAKGKSKGNSGQVVSDCNHRANEKKLQGKDRQEYVEWCTERGERHQYDDRRYEQDRSCYRVAEQKGMSGEARRTFVENCVRRQEKNR